MFCSYSLNICSLEGVVGWLIMFLARDSLTFFLLSFLLTCLPFVHHYSLYFSTTTGPHTQAWRDTSMHTKVQENSSMWEKEKKSNKETFRKSCSRFSTLFLSFCNREWLLFCLWDYNYYCNIIPLVEKRRLLVCPGFHEMSWERVINTLTTDRKTYVLITTIHTYVFVFCLLCDVSDGFEERRNFASISLTPLMWKNERDHRPCTLLTWRRMGNQRRWRKNDIFSLLFSRFPCVDLLHVFKLFERK